MSEKVSIAFSEEQEQLLEVAISFARDKSPVDKVRALIDEDRGYESDVWREMVDLGWLGVALPEAYGGIGLSIAEVVTLAEPMGRHLMATPFYATTLTSQALLVGGTEAQKQAWLPKLAAGSIGAAALYEPSGEWNLGAPEALAVRQGDRVDLSGVKTTVVNGLEADVLIVSVLLEGAAALVLMEQSQIPEGAWRREVSIDETRRTFALTLDGISVPANQLMDASQTHNALKHIGKVGCLLLAADMCGAAQAALDYIVEYLNTRKQFDRLIGSYQALKHPTVDVLCAMEDARSHLYYAAGEFGGPQGDIAVRMAKVTAQDALAFAGDRAIQFHGGFGFTYDCDAQLYRRRAIWGQSQFGDSAYHREKLAAMLFDQGVGAFEG
ncbi:MAG: acyl-CoA dehydrogenase [Alphaproteobacteria bacterium]|nr:MAG: acyl-CoA dehydrogenase [Alphaproteobacteria bacterium]